MTQAATALFAGGQDSVETMAARWGASYRWYVTGAALLGMIAMVLSSTSVSVAVPHVMGAFGVGQDQAQWLATAFFAAQTASMLLTAWASGRFGQRFVLSTTLILFMASATFGAFAPSMDIVIMSRVLQGMAAGIVQPLSMSLIFLVFPPEKRGMAMGLFGLGVVLAPALGPAMGGIAIDMFNWRWAFLLPVPLAAVSLVCAVLFMPNQATAPDRKLDVLGLGLLCVALGCILDGLASGQRFGWSSDRITLELSVGTAALLGFILWELTYRLPLIDLSVFRNIAFASAAMVGFIFGFGMFGSIYALAVFVQTIQGFTATKAGVALIPAGLMMVVMFPIAGRLTDMVRAHFLVMTGLLAFSIAFLAMSSMDANTPLYYLIVTTLISRFGLSLIIPSLNTSALRAVRPDQVPQAAGMINVARMLGGACGINLLVVLLELRSSIHAAQLTATQTWGNWTTETTLNRLESLIGQANLAAGTEHAYALHMLGDIVLAQARTIAFQDVFMTAGLIGFAALVPAWLMRRGAAPGQEGAGSTG